MTPTSDFDVVVVGCGPVGVMTALRCAQRGLSVIAVDRTAEIFPLPRAIGMDDEIQRLFHDAGLGTQLQECSTPLPGAEFVDAAGVRVVGFELPKGATGALGLPPMVMFDQPRLEQHLREAASSAGVEFRFGREAVALDQTHGPVIGVELEVGDEIEHLRGRWLVGADGARSTVRGLLGRSLIDQGFDQPWLVVDTTLVDPNLVLPRLATQYCDPARVVTYVPGHDRRRRWEFQLTEDEDPDAVVAPTFIADLLAPWGSPDQLQIDRAAYYRFHATVVDDLRVGRAFLAGDAAHQMPPFNGQGMCTGMRDAENLAWKFAAVASGEAGPALLDSYDAERRPHAAGQVAHSADAGRLIDAIAAGNVDSLESGYGGGRAFPHIEHGLVHGDHPAVGRPLADIGVALPEGWLLLHARDAPPPPTDFLALFGATSLPVDRARLPAVGESDATVMVRPDRYVAAVTADLDRVIRTVAAFGYG